MGLRFKKMTYTEAELYELTIEELIVIGVVSVAAFILGVNDFFNTLLVFVFMAAIYSVFTRRINAYVLTWGGENGA
jgi:heme O synthase-like polyprenyltransferase